MSTVFPAGPGKVRHMESAQFCRGLQIQNAMVALASGTEPFILCSVYNGPYISTFCRVMAPGNNGDFMGGKVSISSLIPLSLISKWTLPMCNCMSDPDSL